MTIETASILRQIASANRKVDGWVATRNRLIIEAHRSGAGLREIAAAGGLSHMTVKRIINKEIQ